MLPVDADRRLSPREELLAALVMARLRQWINAERLKDVDRIVTLERQVKVLQEQVNGRQR